MGGMFQSIMGRIGLGASKNLLVRQGAGYLNVTQPCVDAEITVSAEGAVAANRREIAIQLKDANGDDIDYQEVVDVFVVGAANLNAIVGTGGSTGIAIGTDGAILATIVAKKHFVVASEADGDIDLTWLDTGTEAAYLALRLPNGRVVFSDALTNA